MTKQCLDVPTEIRYTKQSIIINVLRFSIKKFCHMKSTMAFLNKDNLFQVQFIRKNPTVLFTRQNTM